VIVGEVIQAAQMSRSFEEQVLDRVNRMRPGHEAFCCSIDLLGLGDMLRDNPAEAASRLNDIQRAFGEALLLFPGGDDYRVCFAGDSVFVVLELTPEDDREQVWSRYCGHLFAVCSILQDLELGMGNPGIRVIASYGKLLQIWEPESWNDPMLAEFTRNWFVLTGASEALWKCTEAERRGQCAGFAHGYWWHEDRAEKHRYRGTPFFKIPLTDYRDTSRYPEFFKVMCDRADRNATLDVICGKKSHN